MKRRNLCAHLVALATCTCLLGGLSSALGAASAAADTNPPGSPGCGCELSFTIEKLQEIAGSKAGFTKSRLIGAIGETVDYEIVVTNTSDLPEELSEFTDPHCDPGTIAGGPGKEPLLQEHSTVYTCSHTLTATGLYTNEATVTASDVLVGVPLTKTSNQVVVEVPAPPPPPPPPPPAPAPPVPAFTIEKRQEIAGNKTGFTTAPLSGALGATVDYQIVVKNTGNTALKFTGFTDAMCDQPTISGGPGEGAVVPTASTTYTCSHLLSSAGKVVNTATVTGTATGVAPLTKTSNPVEVTVAQQVVKPVCEDKLLAPRLPTGPRRSAFTVVVSSAAVKQITFYLDGRKLKTFSSAQAKNGKFTIKVDPRKLRYGAHRLSVNETAADELCPPVAKASSFIRPAVAVAKVKFTG